MNTEHDPDFEQWQQQWQAQPAPGPDLHAIAGQVRARRLRMLWMRGFELLAFTLLAVFVASRWATLTPGLRTLVVALILASLAFSAWWWRDTWRRHPRSAQMDGDILAMAIDQARATQRYWRWSMRLGGAVVALVAAHAGLIWSGVIDAPIAPIRASLKATVPVIIVSWLWVRWRVRMLEQRISQLQGA